MTQTLAVNSDNDLYIGEDGNIAIFSGAQAVLQACEQAAKTIAGEMIFQDQDGIPDFQTIWRGGSPNLNQYETALREAILSVQDVTNIESLSVSISNHTLFYNAVINTIYGAVIANGV
jgi:hypothetical protein